MRDGLTFLVHQPEEAKHTQLLKKTKNKTNFSFLGDVKITCSPIVSGGGCLMEDLALVVLAMSQEMW